jgi:hypothetical protein
MVVMHFTLCFSPPPVILNVASGLWRDLFAVRTDGIHDAAKRILGRLPFVGMRRKNMVAPRVEQFV